MNKLNNIKTITEHITSIYSFILLIDKKIASCQEKDNTIRIYDPINNFNCAQVIKRSHFITSICQLEDGTISSSSIDNSITIGNYTIPHAHQDFIYAIITLPNNRIASCSSDESIKIWKSNPPYSDTPIKELKGHEYSVFSLLYIKEKDIMISGSVDETIRFWNMSTYQCESVISCLHSYGVHSIYQIDCDRVIIGGNKTFSIVNINKMIIEKTIKDESLEYFNCFAKLKDNKTILCGCSKGLFCFYDMKTQQYKIENNYHSDDINCLLVLDDNRIISSSSDKTMKVWTY